MYFIGIDHSLRRVGVCLLSYYGKEDPKIWLIKPKKRRGAVRLKYIDDHVRDIVDDHECIYGGVEAGGYSSKGHKYSMGGVNGIVKVALFEKEIPFVEPAPNTLKKFHAGHGHSDKEDMIEQSVSEIDNEEVCKRIQNNSKGDLADAHALAKMARCIGNNEKIGGDRGDAIESVLSNEKRVHTPVSLQNE